MNCSIEAASIRGLRRVAASATFVCLQLPDDQLQIHLVLCFLFHVLSIVLHFFLHRLNLHSGLLISCAELVLICLALTCPPDSATFETSFCIGSCSGNKSFFFCSICVSSFFSFLVFLEILIHVLEVLNFRSSFVVYFFPHGQLFMTVRFAIHLLLAVGSFSFRRDIPCWLRSWRTLPGCMSCSSLFRLRWLVHSLCRRWRRRHVSVRSTLSFSRSTNRTGSSLWPACHESKNQIRCWNVTSSGCFAC